MVFGACNSKGRVHTNDMLQLWFRDKTDQTSVQLRYKWNNIEWYWKWQHVFIWWHRKMLSNYDMNVVRLRRHLILLVSVFIVLCSFHILVFVVFPFVSFMFFLSFFFFSFFFLSLKSPKSFSFFLACFLSCFFRSVSLSFFFLSLSFYFFLSFLFSFSPSLIPSFCLFLSLCFILFIFALFISSFLLSFLSFIPYSVNKFFLIYSLSFVPSIFSFFRFSLIPSFFQSTFFLISVSWFSFSLSSFIPSFHYHCLYLCQHLFIYVHEIMDVVRVLLTVHSFKLYSWHNRNTFPTNMAAHHLIYKARCYIEWILPKIFSPFISLTFSILISPAWFISVYLSEIYKPSITQSGLIRDEERHKYLLPMHSFCLRSITLVWQPPRFVHSYKFYIHIKFDLFLRA